MGGVEYPRRLYMRDAVYHGGAHNRAVADPCHFVGAHRDSVLNYMIAFELEAYCQAMGPRGDSSQQRAGVGRQE